MRCTKDLWTLIFVNIIEKDDKEYAKTKDYFVVSYN